MVKCENWASPFINSLWADTSETWKENVEDWRIVGTNPFRRRTKNKTNINVKENVYESYYIIEFGSRRMDIARVDACKMYPIGTHVILEADRGEDCGKVVSIVEKKKFDMLIRRHEEILEEVQPKKIYREATPKDLEVLKTKKIMQEKALEYCKSMALERDLDMEVVDCEYQWDMNKIIFYFDSDLRIDFRELVKTLYKVYKTRIWMCAIEKSKNKYLRELL